MYLIISLIFIFILPLLKDLGKSYGFILSNSKILLKKKIYSCKKKKKISIDPCHQSPFLTPQSYFPQSTGFQTTSRMCNLPLGLADVDFW